MCPCILFRLLKEVNLIDTLEQLGWNKSDEEEGYIKYTLDYSNDKQDIIYIDKETEGGKL